MELQKIDIILYIQIYEATLASCNLPFGDLRINLVLKPSVIEIQIYVSLGFKTVFLL